MRIGDLVKWIQHGKDYGHLGIVVEVHPQGNYTVYWIKDNEYEWYRKGTNYVMPLCLDIPEYGENLEVLCE